MAPPERINYKDNHGKSPNFGLIVALSSVVLLLILAAAYFLLHRDAKKLMPHGPNPEPNSLTLPNHLTPPSFPQTTA